MLHPANAKTPAPGKPAPLLSSVPSSLTEQVLSVSNKLQLHFIFPHPEILPQNQGLSESRFLSD